MTIKIRDILNNKTILDVLNIYRFRAKLFGLVIDFFNSSRNIIKQIKALGLNTEKLLLSKILYVMEKIGKINIYLTYNPMKSIRSQFKKLWLDQLQFLMNTLIQVIRSMYKIKFDTFPKMRRDLLIIGVNKK